MKIVHICLNCFYIENMEYQENVLPRKHKQSGHEVYIISSTYSFNSKGDTYEREVGSYINKDGIEVNILSYQNNKKYCKILGLFSGLYDNLKEISPDIIFVHGAHFMSIFDVVDYKKSHLGVLIFADQHGDYINSPVDTWKLILIRRVVFRWVTKKIAPYVEMFWGVTPLRVKYLLDVYHAPKNKVGLLVMGGDESKIDFVNQQEIRMKLRIQHDILQDDFLIITGGKIDKKKNIHLLMEAVHKIKSQDKTIQLVVFGQANKEMDDTIKVLSLKGNIHYIGWINSEEAYNWFLASDLGIFPGTHSVLWEQAVACGIPCIFKYWEGMTHVDVGGNCVFLKQDTCSEIVTVVEDIVNNNEKYLSMKNIAVKKGIKEFSYIEIAKKAIVIKNEEHNIL